MMLLPCTHTTHIILALMIALGVGTAWAVQSEPGSPPPDEVRVLESAAAARAAGIAYYRIERRPGHMTIEVVGEGDHPVGTILLRGDAMAGRARLAMSEDAAMRAGEPPLDRDARQQLLITVLHDPALIAPASPTLVDSRP
jgi:hypothetical protein